MLNALYASPAFVISMHDAQYAATAKRVRVALPWLDTVAYKRAVVPHREDVLNTPFAELVALRGRYEIKHGRRVSEGLTNAGAIGCYMSHTEVWREIVARGLPGGWVFEDDVMFDGACDARLRAVVADYGARARFDMITLGATLLTEGRAETDAGAGWLTGVFRFWGTHAYWVSRAGAAALLRDAFPITVQVDSYIAYFMWSHPEFRHVLVQPAIAYQRVDRASSIQENAFKNLCVTCILPRSPAVYLTILLVLVALVAGVSVLAVKLAACRRRK